MERQFREFLFAAGRLLEPAGDRVLVVADNCTDATAAVAREHGVDVVDRFDETRRGKGFALDFGLRALDEISSAPPIVVMLDADCMLAPGALDALARQVE